MTNEDIALKAIDLCPVKFRYRLKCNSRGAVVGIHNIDAQTPRCKHDYHAYYPVTSRDNAADIAAAIAEKWRK